MSTGLGLQGDMAAGIFIRSSVEGNMLAATGYLGFAKIFVLVIG